MFNDDELFMIRDVLNDKIKFLNSLNPTKSEYVEKNTQMRKSLLRVISKIDSKILGIGGNTDAQTSTF